MAALTLLPGVAGASASWDVDAAYNYTIVHNNPEASATHTLTATARTDGACPYRVYFYGHRPEDVRVSTELPGMSWTVDRTDDGAVVTVTGAEPVAAGQKWTFSINYTIKGGEFTEDRVDITLPQPQPDGIFRQGAIVLSVPGDYRLFSNFPSVVTREDAGESKLVTWKPATIPTVVKASFGIGTRPVLTFDNIMRVAFLAAMVLLAGFIIFTLLSHSRHRERKERAEVIE